MTIHATRLRTVIAGTALAASLGVALVGCVGAGTPSPTPTASATVHNTDTGDLKNPVGAITDLTGFSCSADNGVWAAKGKLINAQKSAQTYYVTVAVITPADSNVVGSDWRKITVKAGDSLEFSIDSVAKSSTSGLKCVPRVVRAAA
jgi:hypothetical protein